MEKVFFPGGILLYRIYVLVLCGVCRPKHICSVPLQVRRTMHLFHVGPRIGGVYFSHVQQFEYQEVPRGIYCSRIHHVEMHVQIILDLVWHYEED